MVLEQLGAHLMTVIAQILLGVPLSEAVFAEAWVSMEMLQGELKVEGKKLVLWVRQL